jgi:hypothetical protein
MALVLYIASCALLSGTIGYCIGFRDCARLHDAVLGKSHASLQAAGHTRRRADNQTGGK